MTVTVTVTLAIGAGCSSAGSSSSGRPPTSAALAAVQDQLTSPTSMTTVPAAPPRVLLVGDSTLQAVERYRVLSALRGFDYVYTAESCRTLAVPSCGDPPVPPNALEAIVAAEGSFDTVVVMAGYDEWWTSFPASFDLVVAAARAKGARTIIWLTYREGVGYVAPDGSTANEAFVRNNETLRAKVASGSHPDVILADWYTYSASTTDSLASDGIHLTKVGARGVADYISRYVAFTSALPCPMPWQPGGVIDSPCPNPDRAGSVPDVTALYSTG